MPMPALVFGVVDAPSRTPSDVAEKLRDLTASWCRYSYRGPILTGATTDDVLAAALARGFRHCFVQLAGHVISERWVRGARPTDLPTLLDEFASAEEYLVAGYLSEREGGVPQLSPRCLLVDLERLVSLGSPAFVDLPQASLRAGLPILTLEPLLAGRTLDLGAESSPRASALQPYLGNGIRRAHDVGERLQLDVSLDDDQREFLGVIGRQTGNARRGVFLWNLEPYDDVVPVASARAPVATLYAVSAGFKPNAILHAHGFDANTRVVFMDYSAQALTVRRRIVEEWDGRDFPSFVRRLFELYPSPDTYYHLWGDLLPEALDWRDVEEAWQREVAWWGGAESFREHWQRYRQLPHQYVECDLLTDPSPVLRAAAADPRTGDIAWWSNAFFTMYGNWFHSQAERQEMYERWMAGLAAASPRALLYGSDHANASVNGIHAADYWSRYQALAPGFMEPAALHLTEIRM